MSGPRGDLGEYSPSELGHLILVIVGLGFLFGLFIYFIIQIMVYESSGLTIVTIMCFTFLVALIAAFVHHRLTRKDREVGEPAKGPRLYFRVDGGPVVGKPPIYANPYPAQQPYWPGYAVYPTQNHGYPMQPPPRQAVAFCRTCGAKMYQGDRRCPSCLTEVQEP